MCRDGAVVGGGVLLRGLLLCEPATVMSGLRLVLVAARWVWRAKQINNG